jgi:hypothetical protein
MIMRFILLAAALLLGSLSGAQSAAASTITQTIEFTASNIVTVFGGPPPPVNPVTGSFTLTFDPAVDYWNESAGIILNGININTGGFGGTPMFTYFAGGATQARQLFVGMSMNGAWSMGSGMNDFMLSLSYEPVPFFPAEFLYAQEGFGYLFQAGSVSVTFTPPIAPTPIPASVVMLLTGLGSMGGLAYFRRRKAQGAASAAA